MFTLKVDEEIELQLFQMHDSENLFELIDTNREYLREWLPWVDNMTHSFQYHSIISMWLKQFAENNGFNAGILFHKKLIGSIGFHEINWKNRQTSIGYYLSESAQGHGVMTRCVQALLNYAFIDLGLNRVEIRCGETNIKSRAIPERLGFMMEGKIREGESLYGHYHDLIVYSMLSREWK